MGHGSLNVPIEHRPTMNGIWSIMATIRWCPIFPKWDIYQPLWEKIYFYLFLLYILLFTEGLAPLICHFAKIDIMFCSKISKDLRIVQSVFPVSVTWDALTGMWARQDLAEKNELAAEDLKRGQECLGAMSGFNRPNSTKLSGIFVKYILIDRRNRFVVRLVASSAVRQLVHVTVAWYRSLQVPEGSAKWLQSFGGQSDQDWSRCLRFVYELTEKDILFEIRTGKVCYSHRDPDHPGSLVKGYRQIKFQMGHMAQNEERATRESSHSQLQHTSTMNALLKMDDFCVMRQHHFNTPYQWLWQILIVYTK